ncbi:MAG: peptide chain release factor 2 [Spirochaetales bacterium]|nr:peptide chain release factor 2 [Spirochaetales bacterium]
MLADYEERIENLEESINEAWGIFDSEGIAKKIEELELDTGKPGFWEDRERAEQILGNLKRLKDRFEPWQDLHHKLTDLAELYQLAMDEKDESLEADIFQTLSKLEERFSQLKVMEMLGDEFDGNDAFLTIHSGAGGTEACDWVRMLYRMYSRWIETKEFSQEIIDYLEAEGGIKSVTVQVSGTYAHGFLKGESGIHRLVRISPFDSNARRHTSFASVYVTPVIEDDVEVDIRPEEIRIDTYRAQGAGGQHVNKTDSAVRITHYETGIVVQCQNERSQHKNKALAMKVLKSRLYEYYREEKDKEMEKHAQEKKDISWGNQIRSYVFQPYTMVKDLRTRHETGNIQAVMDGQIDPFIEEYLKWKWKNRK